MGKEFSFSPAKRDDWEPVKTVDVDGKMAVVRRFHYDVLLCFNRPVLNDGKPIIDFYHGSHSPMAYSKSGSSLKYSIKGADAGKLQFTAFKALFFMYEQLLRKIAGKTCETKSYEPVMMDVTEDIALDSGRSKALIVMGEPPTRIHLKKLDICNSGLRIHKCEFGTCRV